LGQVDEERIQKANEITGDKGRGWKKGERQWGGENRRGKKITAKGAKTEAKLQLIGAEKSKRGKTALHSRGEKGRDNATGGG